MTTKPIKPPNESPEPWVNTTGACHHLSISIPTLRRWLKSGKLTAKRTPTGGLRFRQSDLDRLLD